MLDFLKAPAQELVPVDEDDGVRAARELLVAAHASVALLEIEDKKLLRIVSGLASGVTHDDIDAAKDRLAIAKGSQSGWYLPEVRAQRDEVKRLTLPFEQAKAAAKQRLIEAGTAKMRALCQRLADVLNDAQRLAREVEDVCQEIGCGCGEKPVHPFSALLSGEIISWQLEKAKERGLW